MELEIIFYGPSMEVWFFIIQLISVGIIKLFSMLSLLVTRSRLEQTYRSTHHVGVLHDTAGSEECFSTKDYADD